jgi:hypothetical protein
MGDAPTDPKPLEVPLVGHRRILCDVDGADWRVAYYYPDADARKMRELEKRARTGSQKDRDELARVPMKRRAARAPRLREALMDAMTKRTEDGYLVRMVPPALSEVETIARYILEHGSTAELGRTA